MTKIIKIAELLPPPAMVIEDAEGNKHPLEAASVQSYLETVTDLQSLNMAVDPKDEIEVAIRILKRSFPTLKEEQIRAWKIDQIFGLIKMAREIGGEVAAEKDEAKEDKEGKPEAAS